jgi:hypothetical protein
MGFNLTFKGLILIVCGHMHVILHTYMHNRERAHTHTHAYMSYFVATLAEVTFSLNWNFSLNTFVLADASDLAV